MYSQDSINYYKVAKAHLHWPWNLHTVSNLNINITQPVYSVPSMWCQICTETFVIKYLHSNMQSVYKIVLKSPSLWMVCNL